MSARLRNGAVMVTVLALASSWGLRDSEGFKLKLIVSGSGADWLRLGASHGKAEVPTISERETTLEHSRVAVRARRGRPRTRAPAQTREPPPAKRSLRALHLNPPHVEQGRLDLTVTGFDPAAPREIELWRVDGSKPVWLARSTSGDRGAFAFEPLLMGGRDVGLAAAPRGATARAPSASPILWVRRPPVAPALTPLAAEASGAALRVAPAEDAGDVLLGFEGSPQPTARIAVNTTSDGTPLPFEWTTPIQESERCVWALHELPDGRQSPLRFVCSVQD